MTNDYKLIDIKWWVLSNYYPLAIDKSLVLTSEYEVMGTK